MKNLIKGSKDTLFLAIAGLLVSLVLPWWGIVPLFIIAGLFSNRSEASAFGIGFAAAALCWGLYAAYLNMLNAGMLSTKVGHVFMGLSTVQLLWATGTLAGLLGGFAAMTGSALSKVIWPKATV